MRIVKEPGVRRKELLDTAEKLFMIKGYRHTTIDEIRLEAGIAKGTFYHYFQSKEEILDAIIDRIIDHSIEQAIKIRDDTSKTPIQKFQQILFSQDAAEGDSKDNITTTIHEPDNAEMHLKTIVKSIQHLAPILAEVIEEGNKCGDFQTKTPQETIELLLISGQLLFDHGLFRWTGSEKSNRIQAFVQSVQLLLGAPENSCDFIFQLFQ